MKKNSHLTIFLFLFSICLLDQLDARLYFLHIPKTGGTTLRLLLESQLHTSEIYPYPNHHVAKGPIKHELVSGHFPYWYCQKVDDQFGKSFKVTILRDPVQRYLSLMRAKKKADVEIPDLETLLKHQSNPSKKYYQDLISNALCKHLAASPNLEGRSLLESAKKALHEIDVVLFMDNFNQDVIDLFERLDITLEEKDIPKINTTEKEPISNEILEQVKELNRLDIMLYEYAKTHLSKKNTLYPLRTKSFQAITEKTDGIDYSFDLPLNGRNWTYRDKTKESKTSYSVYRWVMNKPADIYFSLEEGSDYDLYFAAQPLTMEVLPRVNVNGQEIEITKLDTALFSTYHGKIPKECLTDDLTEISFYSTKSFQFRDIYPSNFNRNHPPLSFAINRIQISKEKLNLPFN